MAINAKVTTEFGEERELYIRLNSFDQLANHGVPAQARFRGFISEEAFKGSAVSRFMWERVVSFTPDITGNVWKQAYKALEAAKDDHGDPVVTNVNHLDQ